MSRTTLTYDSLIPTHDKFLDYDSKPMTIPYITASVFWSERV